MTFSSNLRNTGLMQCHHLAVTMAVALVFSQHTVVRAEDPRRDTATQQEIVIRTNQDWKRLRAIANSAQEFRALATWAESQARISQQKQLETEDQLRRPYPTNAARNQILTNTLQRYKKEVKYWSDQSRLYTSKAESVAVASGPKQ